VKISRFQMSAILLVRLLARTVVLRRKNPSLISNTV
jgi:hypothetical protein